MKKTLLCFFCSLIVIMAAAIQPVQVSADIDFSGLNDILGIADTSKGYDTRFYGNNCSADDFVEDWFFAEEASNVVLDRDEFTTNGASNVSISFDLAHLPAFPDDTNYSDDSRLVISIMDPEGNIVPVSTGKINGKEIETYFDGETDDISFYPYQFSTGKNTLSVKAHFTARGKYMIYLYVDNIWDPHQYGIDFTVKKGSATAENSLSTDKAVYGTGASVPVTISYSLADDGYDYYMYIVKPDDDGINISDSMSYEYDKPYILQGHDWYSSADEMDVSVGTVHKITEKLKLDTKGTYAVVIYNMDLKKKMLVSTFLVSDDAAGLDVDTSKIKNGVVPFSCEADSTHLSLDSKGKLTLKVQMPFDYDSFMSDATYDSDSDIIDKANINVSLYYTPAGSDTERKIMSLKNLVGCTEKHTITLKASDILDAIVSTNSNDSAYAGIVSVHIPQCRQQDASYAYASEQHL